MGAREKGGGGAAHHKRDAPTPPSTCPSFLVLLGRFFDKNLRLLGSLCVVRSCLCTSTLPRESCDVINFVSTWFSWSEIHTHENRIMVLFLSYYRNPLKKRKKFICFRTYVIPLDFKAGKPGMGNSNPTPPPYLSSLRIISRICILLWPKYISG